MEVEDNKDIYYNKEDSFMLWFSADTPEIAKVQASTYFESKYGYKPRYCLNGTPNKFHYMVGPIKPLTNTKSVL